MNSEKKYLKYKTKYLELKKLYGGECDEKCLELQKKLNEEQITRMNELLKKGYEANMAYYGSQLNDRQFLEMIILKNMNIVDYLAFSVSKLSDDKLIKYHDIIKTNERHGYKSLSNDLNVFYKVLLSDDPARRSKFEKLTISFNYRISYNASEFDDKRIDKMIKLKKKYKTMNDNTIYYASELEDKDNDIILKLIDEIKKTPEKNPKDIIATLIEQKKSK